MLECVERERKGKGRESEEGREGEKEKNQLPTKSAAHQFFLFFFYLSVF